MEYRSAPEIERVGRELIRDYHKNLVNVRVEYVFGEKVANSSGRKVWGRARKITGLNAFFAADEKPEFYEEPAEPFFVIEVAELMAEGDER